MMLLRPEWSARFPELIIAQSSRQGGVSPYPNQALNLGWYTDDERQNVLENRHRFARALGIRPEQLTGGHQVHGNAVKQITEVGECAGYDGFVTDQPDIVLSITIADCTPVLIYDPVRRVCGGAHAGWRGTVVQVARRTLEHMITAYQTQPADCYAWIAAGISRRYFEVSADVAAQFAPHLVDGGYPNDKYRVDLKQANAEQLMDLGVPAQQIDISPACTVADNEHFFSYRKEKGRTGRMLAVIGLLP